MPAFDTQGVNAALEGTAFHGKVQHFASIDSTNTRALADGSAGALAGQVYIADEQTAGRGRGGHNWHSEPDSGLYMTALLRPHIRGSELLRLSLVAGIAAADAIAEVTSACVVDLRWPNDLVIGRQPARKVGGILTEAVMSAAGECRHVAVGIGINLNQQEFPPELQATATSLRRETGLRVSREAVAIAWLQAMERGMDLLCSEDSSASHGATLFEQYERRSTWVQGKRVHVSEDGGYTGVTVGLNAEGLLCIQCDDGTERVVRHGGVREL